jgi:pimeloyl-ACP methyl ester carboxylesterase
MFFGRSDQPLYGVLHSPLGRARDTGVVLLCPGIQEYDKSHWPLRSLAGSLAARGFPVLRFDYRGTGDSAGSPEDATIETWVEDARLAHDEIRDATGVSKVSLVGLRLGAAIAVLTSAAVADVHSLFLWEPVISGARYLEELERADEAARLQLLHPPRRAPGDETGGYLFPRCVRESIARLDLSRSQAPRAKRIAAFVAQPRADVTSFERGVGAQGGHVEVHVTGRRMSILEAQAHFPASESVAQIADQVQSGAA